MMAAMSGTGGGTGAAGSSTGRGGSSSGGGLMRRSAHRASPSASARAPANLDQAQGPGLLMGRLPEPHLGECTQEGQPSSQGQASMTAAQTSNSSRAWPKA